MLANTERKFHSIDEKWIHPLSKKPSFKDYLYLRFSGVEGNVISKVRRQDYLFFT